MGLGMGWVGLGSLCGLLYEHRFAVIINIVLSPFLSLCEAKYEQSTDQHTGESATLNNHLRQLRSLYLAHMICKFDPNCICVFVHLYLYYKICITEVQDQGNG